MCRPLVIDGMDATTLHNLLAANTILLSPLRPDLKAVPLRLVGSAIPIEQLRVALAQQDS
jgi:hypothetical protein